MATFAGPTGTDVAMHAAGVTLMRGDPLLVAGAAMAFSSVSVVSNALLLRRWRPAVAEVKRGT